MYNWYKLNTLHSASILLFGYQSSQVQLSSTQYSTDVQKEDKLQQLLFYLVSLCIMSYRLSLELNIRWVELGGSEWKESVVDKWLSQVVLQVLKRALASHNGLQERHETRQLRQ